jgi:hypothetical protein
MEGLGVVVCFAAILPPGAEIQVAIFVLICFDTPPVFTSSTDGERIDSMGSEQGIDFTSGSVHKQRPYDSDLGNDTRRSVFSPAAP